MDRARRVVFATLFLPIALAIGLAGPAAPVRPLVGIGPAAAAAWPVSTLLLSEVQTGGATASDEFVELTNAGSVPVDLAGLEVVYVTATGGTVTRKAAWTTSLVLDPGRHLLLANALGIHASVADATYSGGLAATGGAIVLRAVGGAPLDAVGWGDATNAFVEGPAAPAPAAGSSLERRPGGIEGNGLDSNDNAADWFVQIAPSPQPLAAPPVPVPSASASPSPTGLAPSVAPTVAPTLPPTAAPTTGASASPAPSSAPSPPAVSTAAPSADPGGSPSPTVPTGPVPSAGPSAMPSVAPSAAPSIAPSAPPSPSVASLPSGTPPAAPSTTPTTSTSPTTSSPTPMPTPAVLSIAQVRAVATGSAATVEGVLTTPLGLLEDGRTAFVQDASGGIALYLDAAPTVAWPAGIAVRVSGTVDERYSMRTLRVAPAAIIDLGAAPVPPATLVSAASVGELAEGWRVTVQGATVGSPVAYADGTGIVVDDGTGQVRVIIAAGALGTLSLPAGSMVSATGPVAQRDSSGTGTGGYRIFATNQGELAVTLPPSPPTPTPAPNPSTSPIPTTSPLPGPTATTSPLPGPTATASPLPTPSPSPTPNPTVGPFPTLPIASARVAPLGTVVAVGGVVTADAGRLGVPALLSIEDGTGGLVLHLDDGVPTPPRGVRVEVRGGLSAPYGQLEVRVAAGDLRVLGQGSLPAPRHASAAQLGEATEARLVVIEGTVAATPLKSTTHDISFDLVDADGGRIRVMADASSGLTTTAVRAGKAYRLTGVAGQRASRKGALDGYRVWLRDGLDIQAIAASASPAVAGAAGPVTTIAKAIPQLDATVTVQASVTTSAMLLDATGRRLVIQDASAAIEVLLPLGAIAPAPGGTVRVTGVVIRAYGAPRLRATAFAEASGVAGPEPVTITAQPGSMLEWRLGRAAGVVGTVTRLGTRWRAELQVGSQRVLVDGLPGSGIPSTALVTGRTATVVGLVRRPYPGATDQRWSLVPRSPADLGLIGGSAPTGSGRAGAGSGAAAAPGARSGPGTLAGNGNGPVPDPVVDVDLAAIGEHPGERVRVGGLVAEPGAAGFSLDDGTDIGQVLLRSEAVAFAPLLESGDAINAIGIVVADPAAPDRWAVLVTAAEGLLRVGDLGEPRAVAGSDPIGDIVDEVDSEDPGPERGSGARLGLGALVGAGPASDSVVPLLLLTAASLIARTVRRRRLRRQARARLTRRLARVIRPAGYSA